MINTGAASPHFPSNHATHCTQRICVCLCVCWKWASVWGYCHYLHVLYRQRLHKKGLSCAVPWMTQSHQPAERDRSRSARKRSRSQSMSSSLKSSGFLAESASNNKYFRNLSLIHFQWVCTFYHFELKLRISNWIQLFGPKFEATHQVRRSQKWINNKHVFFCSGRTVNN